MPFPPVRERRVLRSAPIGACLALMLALVAGDAPARAPVPAYEAEYEVLRNGRPIGSSRITLEEHGDHWRYRSTTRGERGMASMLGLHIEQWLRFQWQDDLPRPLSSHYEQKATLGNRRVSVDYDWSAGRYRLQDRKGEHRHALTGTTVDRYGSGLAIVAQLATGATDFTLPVAHADGVRPWRFKVTGEERIDTVDGAITAIRVERIRDDEDRATASWHDPARGYLAVRLLQLEDGNTIESRLRSYRTTP